ncbi:MAG: hypothetical protein JSW04_01630 [Desulfobacterales bacterium]|nr:MAG: hypothetical protein JSV38_00440 [Desulfobacterales bacterium]UCD90169.1 MAG: hypothetical protein JSW04_01630 [Desulfobacterales bacterium]
MKPNKVVIRFNDGRILKGNTSDFFPNKNRFHLTHLDGKIEEIDIGALKAVFFVKNFKGNKYHQKSYDDKVHGAGRKIKVDFNDNESIIGYALGYSPDRQGFFMTPGDVEGNNERIFVVRSATKNIEFL